MILYTYFRSSAAYRARMALALKGITYEPRYVHLLREGGEQLRPDYRKLNPLGRVPTLIDGDQVFTQSIAIMEYLDEAYPSPPIMPAGTADRARARAITQVIASDIQPLQNLATGRYITQELKQPKEALDSWTRHWMRNGLSAVEQLLKDQSSGDVAVGGHPTIADICIVAQCYASRRFQVAIEDYPHVQRIDAYCRALPAFKAAAPEAQADFEG